MGSSTCLDSNAVLKNDEQIGVGLENVLQNATSLMIKVKTDTNRDDLISVSFKTISDHQLAMKWL